MRSLTLKLTLAFLFVGVIGIVLVAVVVRERTANEFDRFVLDRSQNLLRDELTAYYQRNGSWEGINAILVNNRESGGNMRMMAPVALLDAERRVVYGGMRYHPGQIVSERDGPKGVPVEVDNAVVGWLLFDTLRDRMPTLPQSPETIFLENMNKAVWYGALGAAAIALLLGALLARSISRPVRDLTEGTQRIAQGDLGHQVPVRGQDELGDLAQSFNQMSADLAHANQQRRQMTADIAHDLRTPLSVIMGYTESLSDGKLQGSPEMYRVMHKETQHLGRLIEDLRTLSLADAGELPLTKRPSSPRALLEQMADAHQALAQRKNITLEVQAADGLPMIDVDTDRMAQVLGNLISNALRFTPEGGQVILTAMAEGNGRLQLSVQDNGAGIAPEDLPHIFSRFYRGDKSRLQTGESGLGLAIARSIVEAHGGQITAESILGVGTTFTINLPTA